MATQQLARGQQAPGSQGGQISEDGLAQALQSVMSGVQQQINEIMHQQMDQALKPLRQGEVPGLDQSPTARTGSTEQQGQP